MIRLRRLLHRRCPKRPIDPSPQIQDATRKVIDMTAELEATAIRLRAAIQAQEGRRT